MIVTGDVPGFSGTIGLGSALVLAVLAALAAYTRWRVDVADTWKSEADAQRQKAERVEHDNADLRVRIAAAEQRVDMTTFAEMLHSFGDIIKTQAEAGHEIGQAILEAIQRHDQRAQTVLMQIGQHDERIAERIDTLIRQVERLVDAVHHREQRHRTTDD